MTNDTPPDASGTARKLFRDTDNEMLGGVAGGFANYFQVDVVWVRLFFVLATVFASGIGILLYIAAWIIIPPSPPSVTAAPVPPKPVSDRSVKYWLGVALVGFGGVLLLRQLTGPFRDWLPFTVTGRIIFPLLLIGVGVVVWRASVRDSSDTPNGTLPPPPHSGPSFDDRVEQFADTFDDRVERFADKVEAGITGFASRVEAAVAEHAPPPGSRQVARITLAAALIVFGVAWLVSLAGVAFMTWPRMFAFTLITLGVGSLVGAFRGRGNGIIPLGVVLSIVVLLGSVTAVLPEGTRDAFLGSSPGIYTQNVTVTPQSITELSPSYTFGNGQMVLDLGNIPASAFNPNEARIVEITMGVGDLTINLPNGVAFETDAAIGAGVIDVVGERVAGWQASGMFMTGVGEWVVQLNVRQAAGRMTVTFGESQGDRS